MRRTIAALIAATMLFVADAGTAEAHRLRHTFVAVATGSQEVPAVETDARGLGVFHVSRDGDRIHFKVIATNLDDVLMAHLHIAPRGENGPVSVWLYPDAPPPVLIPGTFRGVLARGVITADDLTGDGGVTTMSELVEEIRAGNVYLNIHTVEHQAGEIRGQLR